MTREDGGSTEISPYAAVLQLLSLSTHEEYEAHLAIGRGV